MARHHVSNTIPVAGVVACVLSAVLCAALLMQSATTSTSTSQGHAHEIPRQLRGVEPFGNTSFATFSYSNLATATACSHLYTLLPGEDCNSLGPLWTTTAATTTTAAAPAASTTQQHRRTATTTTSNPIIVFDAASLLMTIALNSVYIFAAIFKRNTVLFALAHCHDDNVKFSAPVLEILRRPDFGPVMVKIVWFTNIATIVYIAGMLIGIITSLFPVVFWLSYIITVANLCLTAYVLLSHKDQRLVMREIRTKVTNKGLSSFLNPCASTAMPPGFSKSGKFDGDASGGAEDDQGSRKFELVCPECDATYARPVRGNTPQSSRLKCVECSSYFLTPLLPGGPGPVAKSPITVAKGGATGAAKPGATAVATATESGPPGPFITDSAYHLAMALLVLESVLGSLAMASAMAATIIHWLIMFPATVVMATTRCACARCFKGFSRERIVTVVWMTCLSLGVIISLIYIPVALDRFDLYNRCSTSSACEPLWATAGVEGRPSSSSSSSTSTSTSSSTGDGDGDGGTSSSGSSSSGSGSGSTLDCSDGCYVPGSSTFCCPSYVGSRGFIRTSAYVSMILLIEISCVALAALGTSIYSLVRQQRRGDVPYPARSKAIVPGYVITYAVVHLTAEVLWAALPSVINGIFATLPLIVILSIVIATNCHCCCGLRKKPNGQRLVLLLYVIISAVGLFVYCFVAVPLAFVFAAGDDCHSSSSSTSSSSSPSSSSPCRSNNGDEAIALIMLFGIPVQGFRIAAIVVAVYGRLRIKQALERGESPGDAEAAAAGAASNSSDTVLSENPLSKTKTSLKVAHIQRELRRKGSSRGSTSSSNKSIGSNGAGAGAGAGAAAAASTTGDGKAGGENSPRGSMYPLRRAPSGRLRHCPSCGHNAFSKYCPMCGTSMAPPRCPKCDIEVLEGPFCGDCGTKIPVDAAGARAAAEEAARSPKSQQKPKASTKRPSGVDAGDRRARVAAARRGSQAGKATAPSAPTAPAPTAAAAAAQGGASGGGAMTDVQL